MVCPDWFPIRGGLSQTCYELCRELLNHGHELRVIVAGDESVESKGLDVFPVPGCVPRSVEKERRPPLRHQSIISGGNLRVFENLAQTLVAVDAS